MSLERSNIQWDIVVITEINIKKDEIENYNIKGYQTHALTREETKRGGGVMVLLNNNNKISGVEINHTKIDENNGIIINLEYRKHKFEIYAIYRRPDTNKLKYITSLKNLFRSNDKRVNHTKIYLGDINIDILDLENKETDKFEQNMVDKYENIMAKNGFEKLINSPTRVEIVKKKNKEEFIVNKSCIDHIYIKTKSWIVKGFTIEEKIADHYFTACCLWQNNDHDKNENENITRIKYNDKKIINELNKVEWNKLKQLNSVNEIYSEIHQSIQTIYNNNIRRTKGKIKTVNKGRNEWITKETILLIEKKNQMWIKLNKQNKLDEKLHEKYKCTKKLVAKRIKQDKQQFYTKKLENSQNDKNTMWDVIKDLTGQKNNKGNIDQTIKDSFQKTTIKETCDLFNETFNKQIPELKKTYYERVKSITSGKFYSDVYKKNKKEYSFNKSMFIPNPTEPEIKLIITETKNTKSAGIDDISTYHIKETKDTITKAICILIDKMIEEEKWPDFLKTQVLRPLHKKGVKTDINNYRPISLLSIINKIIEKFFANKINEFLNKFKLLTDNQYGYQKNKGTTNLLVEINEIIASALNDGKYVGAIFIDLQKAFDSFDKHILLKKCEKLGLRGKILNIIDSYLSNREMIVKIENICSHKLNIEYGVPQGSVLGPLLFLIYTNDLKDLNERTFLFLFADDMMLISIHYSRKEMIENLQNDFDLLNCWLIENEMYISKEKTLHMEITVPKMKATNENKIVVHGETCKFMKNNNKDVACNNSCSNLGTQTQTKYLGLILDSHWNFKLHCKKLMEKLRYILSKIFLLRNILNNKNKRILYNAWIESQLRYGIEVFGFATDYIINRLQKLQNKIVKVLFGNNKDSTKQTYKKNEILTISKLRDLIIIKNNYFLNNHKKCTSEKQTRLRAKSLRFEIPKWENKYGLRIQRFYVPKIFNRLPKELLMHSNIKNLKPELKKFLLNEL